MVRAKEGAAKHDAAEEVHFAGEALGVPRLELAARVRRRVQIGRDGVLLVVATDMQMAFASHAASLAGTETDPLVGHVVAAVVLAWVASRPAVRLHISLAPLLVLQPVAHRRRSGCYHRWEYPRRRSVARDSQTILRYWIEAVVFGRDATDVRDVVSMHSNSQQVFGTKRVAVAHCHWRFDHGWGRPY